MRPLDGLRNWRDGSDFLFGLAQMLDTQGRVLRFVGCAVGLFAVGVLVGLGLA